MYASGIRPTKVAEWCAREVPWGRGEVPGYPGFCLAPKKVLQ